MYLGPIAGLPDQYRGAWARAERRACGYEQLIATAHARTEAYPGSVLVATDGSVITSLSREEDRLVAQMGIMPALPLADGDRTRLRTDLLRAIMLAASVRSIYFPLLSQQSADQLAGLGARTWARRPTPIIDWSERGQDLAARVGDRLGSRAHRRWRRFQASALSYRCLEGEQAVQSVLHIEARSWKHKAGIGLLHTPRLLAFYLGTLRSRLTTLHVACDGSRPVAYRLDSAVGDVVACLKWSFDDAYKPLSPGFNLLTTGLVERWEHSELAYIDLAGSPDPMKLLMATSLAPRRDAMWPDDNYADELQKARQEYDEALAAGFEGGHGYRALWTTWMNEESGANA